MSVLIWKPCFPLSYDDFKSACARLEKIQGNLADEEHELVVQKANILKDPYKCQLIRERIAELEKQERQAQLKIARLLKEMP